MAGTIANLNAKLAWDLNDFERGTSRIEGVLGNIQRRFEALSASISAFGKRMSLGVTLPLTVAAGASIKAASDAQELQSAYNQLWKGSAAGMNKWAKETGDRLGRATSEMQQFGMSFGGLFLEAAASQDEAIAKTKEFAQLAQDAGSYFNDDAAVAMERIRSGLIGEAEPLRKYNVFLSEAAVKQKALEMGLISTGQELNEQGKIMARAALIVQGLTAAQGDLERTSNDFANRVARLKANLTELAEEIGTKLLPVAEMLVGMANSLVEGFAKLPEPVKNFAGYMAMATAAMGPLVMALAGLATLILPFFISKFGLVGKAIITFLNPIGVAINYLIKFGTTWAAISKALSTAVGWIVRFGASFTGLTGPIGWAIAAIILFKDDIIAAFRDIWGEAEALLGPDLRELFKLLGEAAEIVGQAWDAMMSSALVAFLGELMEAIGHVVYALTMLAGSTVVAAINAVVELVKWLADAVTTTVDVVTKLLTADWKGAWDAASNYLQRTGERMKGWLDGIGRYVTELLAKIGFAERKARASERAANNVLGRIKEEGGGDGKFWSMHAVNENNKWADEQESNARKDYALASDSKDKKSKARSGPTAAELAAQREMMRLEQQLAVARARDDKQEEERLQRRIDLIRKADEYQRAGLSRAQALAAAQADINELIQAEEEARAKAFALDEKAWDLKLARIREDYADIRAREKEAFLQEQIAQFMERQASAANSKVEKQAALEFANRRWADIEDNRAINRDNRLAEQQRRHDIELARMRGDSAATVRAMEEADRRLSRIEGLMSGEDGLDLADAEAIANREALERNRAFTQGFYRDTLKGAFQAALDGNLSDFFSNWLKDSMFNALEDVLNRLADSLADLFSKQQGGSGGGGLLGSIGAILGGVFGGGGGGGSFGGGVSVGAARGMSADVYSGFIPGFNTGGSFTFQGLPGIDRNILSLNGSPIARVSKGEVANIQRSGGAGARSQVEVIPSPYFDVRVREVAAPLASQAAQGAVQASEERSMKRQRRSLG